MRRLMLMMSVALLLVGCAMPGGEYLEYTSDAFSASIEGKINGFEFTADLVFGAPPSGEAPCRDVEMIFRSPATLSGVKIKKSGGKITVSSGNMSIETESAAGWLGIAELLIPDGTVNDVKILKGNTARLAQIEMTLADSTPLTLTIDCSTSFPVRIVHGDTEIHIAAFGDGEAGETSGGTF